MNSLHPSLTFVTMHQRVYHVDKVAQVVQSPPESFGMVVNFPEHGPAYHKDDVVQHGYRYHKQPLEDKKQKATINKRLEPAFRWGQFNLLAPWNGIVVHEE